MRQPLSGVVLVVFVVIVIVVVDVVVVVGGEAVRACVFCDSLYRRRKLPGPAVSW